jgi:hypothetical protein
MAVAKGPEVHGEFASADASALTEPNSRFALYPGGSTSAITLGSSDVVYVTALMLSATSTILVTVYDGATNGAGAGTLIFQGVILANTTVTMDWTQAPHRCQKGTYPKVKAAAGQVYAGLKATIYSQP